MKQPEFRLPNSLVILKKYKQNAFRSNNDNDLTNFDANFGGGGPAPTTNIGDENGNNGEQDKFQKQMNNQDGNHFHEYQTKFDFQDAQ